MSWMRGWWCGGLVVAVGLVACAAEVESSDDDGGREPFTLSSTAFEAGDTIPLVHECGAPFVPDGPGDNETPPLSWTEGPDGTESYAVVMRDLDFRPPDYPEGLIHWAIYDIPASVRSLPQAVPEGRELDEPAGARQAEMQESGLYGYFGPCSPADVNTYELVVYAIGQSSLDVGGNDSEIRVAAEAESSALDSASLAGES